MAGRTQPCRAHKTSTWNLIKLIKMGYKILDVKADIHEDIERYFEEKWPQLREFGWKNQLEGDVLDIVDEHFEKIDR